MRRPEIICPVYAELKIHEFTPITSSRGLGSMRRRVAITDIRISSPMGKKLAEVHDSLQEARSGFVGIDDLKLQPLSQFLMW